jgi:hypothetical protein
VTVSHAAESGIEEAQVAKGSRAEKLFAVAVVACAVLYRPLTFWADNASDVSVPLDLFATAALEFSIALPILVLVLALPTPTFPTALIVAWAVFTVFNWGSFSTFGFLVAGAIALGFYSATVFGGVHPARVTVVVATVCVVAPLLLVANAHLSNDHPYPLTHPPLDPTASATGAVDDLLILVVDGYPMAAIAEGWFGHDLEPLWGALDQHGFSTPEISWSHNTFTSLAVPSMLELSQVVEPAAVGLWRHQKDNYDTSRGSNFTVSAFRSAGFHYTHIESGWNGDECHSPDTCLATSWMDEANWQLLKPAVFHPLVDRFMGTHMVPNSFATIDHLIDPATFVDGRRDLVYAHILLPHPPYLVDSSCEVRPPQQRLTAPNRIAEQFACTDSLLIEILEALPRGAAVLIAGDHGTASRGQNFLGASEWSDADVAERLGALLSYRIPPTCTGPEVPSNLSAMRALTTCALNLTLPEEDSAYVLGLDNPHEIAVERLDSISEALSNGELARDS